MFTTPVHLNEMDICPSLWTETFLLLVLVRLTGEVLSPVLSHVFEFTWRLWSSREPRRGSEIREFVLEQWPGGQQTDILSHDVHVGNVTLSLRLVEGGGKSTEKYSMLV